MRRIILLNVLLNHFIYCWQLHWYSLCSLKDQSVQTARATLLFNDYLYFLSLSDFTVYYRFKGHQSFKWHLIIISRHLDKDRLAELERMDRYPEKQAVYSVDKPFRQTSLDLRHNAATANWHPARDFTRSVMMFDWMFL